MNGYVFYIFIKHSIVLENKEEDGTFTTYCDLIEIGPLNMPDSNNLKKIMEIIYEITSTTVTSNWGTDFITWDDFHGILRSGGRLPMHSIVTRLNRQLTHLERNVSYLYMIDNNRNMIIEHDETFQTMPQGFKVTANRKRLRTLKEIAAAQACINLIGHLYRRLSFFLIYKLMYFFIFLFFIY